MCMCMYVYMCMCVCARVCFCGLANSKQKASNIVVYIGRAASVRRFSLLAICCTISKSKKRVGEAKKRKKAKREEREKKKNEGLKRWTSGGIAECVCCRCPTTVLLFVLFACPAALQIVRVFFFFLTFIDVCRQVCKASVRRRICKTIA